MAKAGSFPHEGVFSRNVQHQDVLWKFTIPATERIKVLKKLDSYSLNAFSLFESDEALMETMAIRYVDFKQTAILPLQTGPKEGEIEQVSKDDNQ